MVPVVLVRTETDEIHVFSADCPHRGSSLGGGPVEDGCLVCPWHGWRFRLSDGESENGDTRPLERYPAEIRDGDVWVKWG